ncbi:MAG: UDP-2,3-diacylglucosamine diphosphatase [Bacteroidaceae bacterium]|nr:UDP-2,3-diacylglucosamine diphosphatase [Bacteroidaceae bacterium]
MKNIYFISDAHLGSRAIEHRRTQERRLVNFLDKIKDKAEAVYMLGDMFDFWFEYKEVVPKGYTRFLGKISELTDMGVEVHYFTGNHDLWMDDYLEKECGVTLHRQPCTLELRGKVFYLAHGDRLGIEDKDWKTRFMFRCFHSKTLRRMAKWIHPHWFMNWGLEWAKHSRMKRKKDALQSDADGRVLTKEGFHNDTRLVGYESAPDNGEEPYRGEDQEGLVLYAKEYLKTHPEVNYFIFGHRHIELDLMLSRETRLLILGEWITLFTYAVWDGEHLFMDNFIEGETEL